MTTTLVIIVIETFERLPRDFPVTKLLVIGLLLCITYVVQNVSEKEREMKINGMTFIKFLYA